MRTPFEHRLKSYLPMMILSPITLYGSYLFLQTFITDEVIIHSLLALIGLLLFFFEYCRIQLISEWLGAKLERILYTSIEIPHNNLTLGFGITALLITLNVWGATQIINHIEKPLTNSVIEKSEFNKEVKSEEQAVVEVEGYLKIFFWVFLGISILFHYFPLGTLFDEYERVVYRW